MFAKALSKFFHLKAFPKGPIQKARSKRPDPKGPIPKADLNKMKAPSSVSFPTTS